MRVEPYVFFEGRCEEAMQFYKKALGAETVALMRYSENPQPIYNPPGGDDKIMHGALKIGESMVLVSDGQCQGSAAPKPQGFSLVIHPKDAAEADKYFAALGEDGKVMMPMDKTFFAERFGMVADKFGIGWMLIVDPK